ncbi:MAG: ATP-dependent Clp protease ATP-binding subunit [Oscillospiraceae bacterium]|nr:ATP-dependent Clp protease ATP-binding subunit [Oscillospiraceae bacterium]
MLCSRCKKRTAVVFITAMHGEEKRNEGLCLVCAKKMGIPQVDEYMQQMGISDEEIEEFSDTMTDFSDILDGDSFQRGGTGAIPNFIQNLFGGNIFPGANANKNEDMEKESDASEDNPQKNEKKERIKPAKPKYKFLDGFCTNLSQRAREGKIDNIVGRDKEIERTIQILTRRQKNNPCLIGEPGVGKTAIAEGIALKIMSGDVPFHIADKELYLLDLTSLVAGTQFRGQFESRVKGLIDDVISAGNVILFIDEVHSLVGTGDSEGSMNAANLLKPALSRGEIQVIGATTFTEYRKYIEKDGALERRFQPVTVGEPTIEDTYKILIGIREYYEDHHHVRVSDELLRMCAVFSERYINDRFLPDKAIDLLDEACACRSIRSAELAMLARAEKKMSELEDRITEMEDEVEPDYEKIAECKAELIQVRDEADKLNEKANNILVDENDIAYVIELWTGIPANKIAATEYKKLAVLDDNIRSKIIGQDKAVELVSKAIRRTRIQLNKRRRPASFIFVGPTGVGKTELVKVLATELFDGTEPLIRLDMTEYMEKHTVSRLIGSPPGYVGYDDAGQLTEKVRRRPYSVVLFDEIEKAHPDVMNILLQILDEGKVKDSQGRSVSFENTVICMTSNAGSSDKTASLGFNKTEGEMSKDKAMKALSDFLRPEFMARIDEIVVFDPLSEDNFKDIAGLMLDEMKEPLAEKNITFRYDKRALSCIASKSYGGKFGARDIRKFIRTDVEDKLAELIVNNPEGSLTKIKLTAKKNELVIETNLDKAAKETEAVSES